MPTIAEVRDLLDRYCSAMSDGRRDDWLACFAHDAVQEDPVGTPANVGREAIGAFFDASPPGVTLVQTADPIVLGDEVIAFFRAEVTMEGQDMVLPRIVDHIRLDASGTRFAHLRAFFDYGEIVPA